MKDGNNELGRRRRSSADSGDTKKPTGKLVGLDIGYGHTKIVTHDGDRHIFPSVVSAIAPTPVEHYGAPTADDEVIVERIRCIVGERAIGAENRYMDLHNVWWITPTYKAIIAQASKFIPAHSTVIAGLPISAYTAAESRAIVEDLVKTGLKAKRVLVAPQGIGAYYSDRTIYHPTNKVALVDIGNWTTEFIAIAGKHFIDRRSLGVQIGVSDIYATVAHELTTKLGRPIDPSEVERSSRGNGDIRAQGRAYDQHAVDDRVSQLAKDRATQILSKMVSLWGAHAAEFETVLFCGGGAQLLFPYLKSYREGAILMNDSQFANAVGFLKIGELMFGDELATAVEKSTHSDPPVPTDNVQPMAV
jgi:plasmid segregation protein ParM